MRSRAPSPRVGVRQEGQTVRLIWGVAADAHGQAEGALATTLHVKRDTADLPGADRSGVPDRRGHRVGRHRLRSDGARAHLLRMIELLGRADDAA